MIPNIFIEDWRKEARLNIPARRVLKAGLAGPYQSVKGQVSGLDAVNDLDTEYFRFVTSATVPEIFLLEMKIIARSLITVAKAEGL